MEIFYAYYRNTAVHLDPLPVSFSRLTVVEPALFEMTAPIRSPAKCGMRSAVRFLKAKIECPAEIHKQIVAVYGKVMDRQHVTKWCHGFSKGRTDVQDEKRSCRLYLISYDLLQEIE